MAQQVQKEWRPEDVRGDSFILCLGYAILISIAVGIGYGVAEGMHKGFGDLCLAIGTGVVGVALALKTFAILERWQRVPSHIIRIRELMEKWDAHGGPIDLEVAAASAEQLAKLAEKWERGGVPVAFATPSAEQARAEER